MSIVWCFLNKLSVAIVRAGFLPDLHPGSMLIMDKDVDREGDVPSPDVPSPGCSGKQSIRDNDNDNLTCYSSQDFEDTKQSSQRLFVKDVLAKESFKMHLQIYTNQTENMGKELEKRTIALPQFRSKRTAHPSHLDSYQIYNLFNPTRGIRDEMARKGITPRNHHKENIAAIAIKSAKVHSSKEFKGQESIYQSGCYIPDTLSTTSENSQMKTKKISDKVDYLARNISGLASAAEIGRKKRDFKTPEVPENENYGKIPPYLLRRKLELLHCKEEREQEERERHLPPGLVLMKDDERLEGLTTLEEKKEKLVAKLRDLPLVVETPGLVRAKGEVEAQLKEVEDSIKHFSRPKVYIRYTNS